MSPALKCVALRVLQLPPSSLHWETHVLLWKVSLKMPAVFSHLDAIFFWKDLESSDCSDCCQCSAGEDLLFFSSLHSCDRVIVPLH